MLFRVPLNRPGRVEVAAEALDLHVGRDGLDVEHDHGTVGGQVERALAWYSDPFEPDLVGFCYLRQFPFCVRIIVVQSSFGFGSCRSSRESGWARPVEKLMAQKAGRVSLQFEQHFPPPDWPSLFQ